MLPVSADFIEGVEGAPFSRENVFGGLGPGEGLWLCIVLHQVVVDGGFQVVDVGVTAAPDAL